MGSLCGRLYPLLYPRLWNEMTPNGWRKERKTKEDGGFVPGNPAPGERFYGNVMIFKKN